MAVPSRVSKTIGGTRSQGPRCEQGTAVIGRSAPGWHGVGVPKTASAPRVFALVSGGGLLQPSQPLGVAGARAGGTGFGGPDRVVEAAAHAVAGGI